jgi:hypothetical protein
MVMLAERRWFLPSCSGSVWRRLRGGLRQIWRLLRHVVLQHRDEACGELAERDPGSPKAVYDPHEHEQRKRSHRPSCRP